MPSGHRRLILLAAGALALAAVAIAAALMLPARNDTPPAEPPGEIALWQVAADSGWRELEAGLELREEHLEWWRPDGERRELLDLKLSAVRLDPRAFAMRIVMNPVELRRKLPEVAKAEGAPVVSNGAYFGQKGEPVTLLVSGGRPLSKPSRGLPYSGVFSLGADGRAAVRPLHEFQPPYEGIDFAIQNSPLLICGGRIVYADTKFEHRDRLYSARRHRRTGLGVAADGRVVLLVCDSYVGLAEFAEILAAPEASGGFALQGAVNLDGGPSSGLAVDHPRAQVSLRAGPIIPHVIAVGRRAKPLGE